jgi:hypothetical protein
MEGGMRLTKLPMLAAVGLILTSSASAQQAGTGGRVAETTRITALADGQGATQRLRLSLGALSLSGARKFEVPASGYYVVTLVSGDVITETGGQQVTRHTGDSWAVAGDAMSVELQGREEVALLEIFRVGPPSSP